MEKPLLKRKNKKVIGVIKEEIGGKIILEFVGLKEKSGRYLKHDSSED